MKTLSLLICLAQLFIPIAGMGQEPLIASRGKQTKDSPGVDVLWINILATKMDSLPHKYPQASYFELQSDGGFVSAEGDEPTTMKVVRSGVVSQELVRRAFQIVDRPSVVNARDTEPGEQIFSTSDWVSVGLIRDWKVKGTGGWAYQEELKDFPAEFQKLIAELKSIAVKMPRATDIKALISAAAVDTWRIELIGRNRFIALDDEGLNRLPALRQAVLMSRRMVAVKDATQMSRFAELARRMNPESAYWGLYTIRGQGYEVHAYYLQGAPGLK